MTSKVETPGYWIEDAIKHLRYAAELADKPEVTKFAELKGEIFVAWLAIRIAEDSGADTLKPLADYLREDTPCFTSQAAS